MASSDDERKQHNGRGFAGLGLMVSDVEETLESLPESPKVAEPAPSPQKTARVPPTANDEMPDSSRGTSKAQTKSTAGSSLGRWIFVIVMVGVIIWWASLGNSSGSSAPTNPSYASTSKSSSSPSAATAPSWQPPTAPSLVPVRLTEQKPPIGSNTPLSGAQIRYCLAEDIRLEGARSELNNSLGSDVDRFNRYIDDYNSRCATFRYLEGTLAEASSDVEIFRSDLFDEGRNRFRRSSVTGASGSITLPDPTVEAIQRRLNELGYDTGPADGLMGARTVSAIIAFQEESGLQADGVATQELLQKALRQVLPKASDKLTAIMKSEQEPQLATLTDTSEPSALSKVQVAKVSVSQPPEALPQAPSSLGEQKPPISLNNVLSEDQLRYCFAESIRLQASRSAANENIDSEVARLNMYTRVYNSRCGDSRYQDEVYERIRLETNKYRSQFEAEGRSRIVNAVVAPTPVAASTEAIESAQRPEACGGSDVQLIRSPVVEYPQRAADRGIEGSCEVRLDVDIQGKPYNVKAACTHSILEREAERAVRQARFEPKVENGQAIICSNVVFPLEFRLGHK